MIDFENNSTERTSVDAPVLTSSEQTLIERIEKKLKDQSQEITEQVQQGGMADGGYVDGEREVNGGVVDGGAEEGMVERNDIANIRSLDGATAEGDEEANIQGRDLPYVLL